MKIPERRGMERFSLEFESCRISCNDSSGRDTENFCVENICAGGAFIKTEDILPIGTDVMLDMILPVKDEVHLAVKQSHITVMGEVIRTAENGMAIGFGKKYTITPHPG